MLTNRFRAASALAVFAGAVLSVRALLAADLNPVARWSFEDADNIGKDSVGSADLLPRIASTTYATPARTEGIYGGHGVNLRRNSSPVGNALMPDAQHGLPTGNSPFTFSGWIKSCGSHSQAYIACYLYLTGGAPKNWETPGSRWSGWYLRFNGQNLLLCFGGWRSPPASSDSTDIVAALPVNARSDQSWHHVAFSRDANNLVKLYFDGAKIAERTISYAIDSHCRLVLGSYEEGNFYDGYYDEVCFFDRALHEGEIAREYFRGNDIGVEVDELGRVILNAPAGAVVTNEVSLSGGSQVAKTGEGTVLIYHSSGNYMGSVGVTNGLLRTGEIDTFRKASGFAVEPGATLELGRSGNYAASFSGAGTVRLSGAGVFNLTGNLGGFSGAWSTYLATVNFGTSSAPVLPEASASLDIGNGGFVNFFDDVTVSALSGKGLLGGVALPDGKTLTVNGNSDTSFAGCLAGQGSLVKAGSGELALSGASSFTNVTVSSGTLALDGVKSAGDARSHWKFEDANDLSLDSGLAGVPLKVIKSGHDAEQVEGIVGKAIRIGVPSNGSGCILATDASPKLPRGTSPYTFSAWLRPLSSTSPNVYLVRFMKLEGEPGAWSNTGWGTGWYLCCHTAGTKLAVSYNEGWSDVGGAAKYKAEGDLPSGAYHDGRWHHVAITLDSSHSLRLYWDGELIGENLSPEKYNVQSTARLQFGSYELKDNHNFDGDVDEVQYLDGAWSAERVAEEYAARRPLQKANPLPTPLAWWTFDRFETDGNGKFFRDNGTAGWNFYEKNQPNVTRQVTCIDATHAYGQGVNGGAAYVDSANLGAFLRVGDHVSPKVALPNNNPDFTLSIRFRNIDNVYHNRQVFFAFGSVQTRDRCFRLTYEGVSGKQWEPKTYRIIPGSVDEAGDGWALDDAYASHGATSPWITLTFVNEETTRTVTAYRDGIRIGTYATGYNLDLDRILLFAGWYNGNTPSCYAGYAVDDLRIYRELLTPSQVQALVYEQAGVTPAPLVRAKVSLADATTLRAKGGDQLAAAVAGSGDVQIDGSATFGAHDWSGFSGTVRGEGALALFAKLPSGVTALTDFMIAGAVTDADGAGLPVANAPDKTVRIAASGVVKVTDAAKARDVAGRTFVLARAASFDAPADFSGWTVEPSDAEHPAVFSLRNGEFRVKIKGGGMTVIVR